jgi:signal transduction histidine kinase
VARTLDASIRLASFDKDFKQLRLTTHYDEDAPLVSADADQLQQVFLNLLLNARDAMPGGGDLHISTSYQRDAQELLIEIADTGQESRPNIARVSSILSLPPSPPGAGTGLGLAVCYGIITAHNGRIEVASNNNRGTTLRVSLPIPSGI